MSLQAYADRFARLVVNVSHGQASPHKICMLLAVFDLAKAGGLAANRIVFATPLLERYRRYFDAVQRPGDHPSPYFPFFHLSGKLRGGEASFWHLHAIPGREAALSSMDSARSLSDITENVSHASLDDELHLLLQVPASADKLIDSLARHWFDRGLQDLEAVVKRSSRISNYERMLRDGLSLPRAGEAPPPLYVRDSAFRRVVTQVYDYRCAATGLRILLPSGEAMVEAAHIHPFSEAGDDDPRNGLALSPNMHWAMDRNLIAPGPDYCWHVSTALDRRIADFRTLYDLDGRELLLPTESRMYPKRSALEWRMARLRDADWIAPDAT